MKVRERDGLGDLDNQTMVGDIGTKDPEYLGLHKNFKELSHYVDTLADDARIFRDSIAGNNSNFFFF